MRFILRPFRWLFLLIAEPRVTRIIQFALYVSLSAAGYLILATPPNAFKYVIGAPGVFSMGVFLTLGGLAGAIAVLPGTWWLERMGIISTWTALGLFCIIAIALGISPVGCSLAIALALALLIRFLEIRKFQYAPGR